MNNNCNEVDYHINLSKKDINIWVAILIGSITAFLTVMLKAISNDQNDSYVFILYFNIVIVLLSVYSLKAYGILVAFVSSVLFNLTLEKFFVNGLGTALGNGKAISIFINAFINVIQATIIWIVLFKLTKFNKDLYSEKRIINDRFKIFLPLVDSEEKVTNDRFKILLLLIGLIYIVVGIGVIKLSHHDIVDIESFLFVFAIVIISLYVFEGICMREKCKKLKMWLLLICFIPSGIAAFINSMIPIFFGNGWFQSYILWVGSNFILLSTFGYVLFNFLSNINIKESVKENSISIKIPVVLYYISIMLWNFLFFAMYIMGWLDKNTTYTITYIFPWLIGNILFISNFILSQSDETILENKNEIFNWFEKRAIVAEANTAIVMQIVVLAVPLIMAATNIQLSPNIIIIFVLNISISIASIALIWVPQNNIKFMSFLKTLKTILHLFSISLLLLNSIMFINEFAFNLWKDSLSTIEGNGIDKIFGYVLTLFHNKEYL